MLVVLLELVKLFFFFDCCCVLTKSPLACFINLSCLLINTERGSANELEALQDVGVGEQAVIAAVEGAGFHHDRDAIVTRASICCTITTQQHNYNSISPENKKTADDKCASSINFAGEDERKFEIYRKLRSLSAKMD